MNNKNTILPITSFRTQILETVRDHKVSILVAETGAGKSTQVPQYLFEAGYTSLVTQPRRLAARTVAARVAAEMGESLGGHVGVRTRDDRVVGPDCRILFATDGLALIRELIGVGNHDVLVIDECHEWNLNQESLVAWSRKQLELGQKFKLVLMSATMDAPALSTFFWNAPIIQVPGRCFPVEEKQPSQRTIAAEAEKLVRAGRNVLVFQPGKAEIVETVAQLQSVGVSAEILPLHGELSPEDQAKCFKHYGRPKVVVSTNVAQTSITIDDIDAVVDSGLERRVEMRSGVEGLYLRAISFADAKQRRGRAGRCKAGIYIDCCPTVEKDRTEFPVAEINRSRLDQTVLRLAEAGIDAEELRFFHQPNIEEIRQAKRSLRLLGCLDASGKVTPKGRRVSTMPISIEMACMVLEADKRGVLDDVLTIASLVEVGGITQAVKDEFGRPTYPWKRYCKEEKESDLLAQLQVSKVAEEMCRKGTKDQLRSDGINAKRFFQAKDTRRALVEALHGRVRFGSTEKREDIIKSIVAGLVDHLYSNKYGTYYNGSPEGRELGRESVVSGADWLVGLPFDLEIQTRRGKKMLLLVHLATMVSPAWLGEVAPQLVEVKTGLRPCFDASKDSVVSTTETYFNGQKVKEEVVADPTHAEATSVFAQWLAGYMV
jgi:HrpA-like RNA helicase